MGNLGKTLDSPRLCGRVTGRVNSKWMVSTFLLLLINQGDDDVDVTVEVKVSEDDG
jgi:hypothetical protein